MAAVVAFHLRASWASGGFIGVSVFFTLSGFLITRLLLNESATTGGIRLGRFWSRRIRRLLPASVVTVVGVLVATAALEPARLGSVRADATAAILNIANWRSLTSDASYGALFDVPSPLLHFWSLAIEEQFYLAYPLLVWGAMMVASRRGRSSQDAIGVLGVALTGIGLLAIALSWGDANVSYYSTFSRIPELSAGALLAWWVARRTGGHERVSDRLDGVPAGSSALTLVGVASLGVLIALTIAFEVTDSFWAKGGFLVVSMASCGLLWAAMHAGPLRAALTVTPLVGLGVISYGVYLAHWPVIQFIDGTGSVTGGALTTVTRLMVTGVLAVGSYLVVEQPIRLRKIFGRRASLRLAAPGAVLGVLVLALGLAAFDESPVYDFDQAGEELAAAADAEARQPADDTPGAADANRPLRVAVFGDSTARMLAWGVLTAAGVDIRVRYVGGVAELGCGISRDGERRYVTEDAGPIPDVCSAWAETWPAELAAHPADVALVLAGPWDISDRLIPGVKGFVTVGDAAYDDYLLSEIVAANDVLAQSVSTVVWATSPYIDPQNDFGGQPLAASLPVADPARTDRLNELIRTAASLRPDMVILDLNGYLANHPEGAPGDRLRPDGIHLSFATSPEVSTDWMIEELLRLVGRGN